MRDGHKRSSEPWHSARIADGRAVDGPTDEGMVWWGVGHGNGQMQGADSRGTAPQNESKTSTRTRLKPGQLSRQFNKHTKEDQRRPLSMAASFLSMALDFPGLPRHLCRRVLPCLTLLLPHACQCQWKRGRFLVEICLRIPGHPKPNNRRGLVQSPLAGTFLVTNLMAGERP